MTLVVVVEYGLWWPCFESAIFLLDRFEQDKSNQSNMDMSGLGFSEVDPQMYRKVLRVRAGKVFDWVHRSCTFSNLVTASVMLQPAENVMSETEI